MLVGGEHQNNLQNLICGPMFPFSRGLHETLPLAVHGVYTIWKQDDFLYVGIAGVNDLSMEPTPDALRGLGAGGVYALGSQLFCIKELGPLRPVHKSALDLRAYQLH